ncbi:MAG: hypothetical protein ACP5FT_00795 [Acidilobus sp.]
MKLVKEVEKAQVVEVSSLADLARLAVTMLSFAVIMPIYRYFDGTDEVYFVQTTYRDYFNFYGIPIVYLYRGKASGDSDKAKYVLIKVDETGERVEIGDKARPGWTSIPIITLKEKPNFLP